MNSRLFYLLFLFLSSKIKGIPVLYLNATESDKTLPDSRSGSPGDSGSAVPHAESASTRSIELSKPTTDATLNQEAFSTPHRFKLRADSEHRSEIVRELGYVTVIGTKDLKFDHYNQTYASQESHRHFVGEIADNKSGEVEDVLWRDSPDYHNRPGYLRLFAQDIFNFPIFEGYWRPPPYMEDIKRDEPSLGHHNRFYSVILDRFPNPTDSSCVFHSK